MGIISFESFALVCIFVALGAYLVWQQIKEAGRSIEATLERKPEDAVSGQAQEDEKERRRMEFEADAKFWRELGQENLDKFTTSMEPFCGEGKKP